MSLAYRMKRLVKADLHGFVEGLENPKWVLAQAIRDMEEELEKLDGAVTAKESHLLKLIDGITSCQESLDKLNKDIDFAIREKREEIAKSLIRKLLFQQKNFEAMKEEEKNCQKELKEMQLELRTRQQSYQEIQTRSGQCNFPRSDDDVFSAAEQLVPSDQALEHQVELEFLRRLQASRGEGRAK